MLKLLRTLPVTGSYLQEFGRLKPKPIFKKGLFKVGHSELLHGGLFPQMLLRDFAGNKILSDEVLGPYFTVISLEGNLDLDEETKQRWAQGSGHVVHFCSSRNKTGPSENQYEIASETFPKSLLKKDWCVVVRPDRTILHDGPSQEASRIIAESLFLISKQAPVKATPFFWLPLFLRKIKGI